MAQEPNPQPAEAQGSARRSFLLYLAYACGIAVLLSLFYLFKGRVFAFVDIGLDLFTYYYPIQIVQAHQLRQLHQLTWSFDLGLGGYIGGVFNPTQLATAWLPDAWQLAIRLPTYLLKIVLAGALFFGYLRKIRFEPGLATIGALAFCFSSYAIVNEQWDGPLILQFAASLLLFEGYCRSRNIWYAVAAGLVVGSGAAFDIYTLGLLGVLYALIRPAFVGPEDNRGPYLSTLLGYGCWVLLGLLVTAFIQLPNLHYLFDSPRVSGDHSKFDAMVGNIWQLNSSKIVGAEIAGLFGKDLLGTGSSYRGWSNYFEAPGFYVGMLLLLCLPQLLGPKSKRREKQLCLVGLLLLAAYILWPALRHAVYGFGHNGFRQSTLWVSSGLLVLGLAGLRRVCQSGVWRRGLIVSGLLLGIVVLAIAWHMRATVSVRQLVMVISFTSVYCIVLWSWQRGATITSVRILTAVFACELLLFSLPAMTERTTVRADGASVRGSYNDGTLAALASIRAIEQNQEFYRIEKTYQSVFLNDALVQGYSGTKSYWFHGGSITRFVDKMDLPRTNPRTNYIASMDKRTDVLSLLGVKYLLARDRKLEKTPGMLHIGNVGKIHIYRNTAAHGVGHLYGNIVAEDAANALPPAQRDKFLLDHVTVENPREIQSRLALMKRQSVDAERDAADRVILRKFTDIHLHADVDASQASALLIAMPFDTGWRAKVDNVRVDLFRADYGLTALLVPAGTHQVDLSYRVPGRKLGKWLSLAALLVLLGIGASQWITARRRYR